MRERLSPDFLNPRSFVLVVGNARSGTTIVGSIIDSHPRMICANETTASANFWRGLDRREILEEIAANSAANYASNRPSEDYVYAIETEAKFSGDIAVIGDKVWNPALLLMAGQSKLLDNLQELMRCSVVLVHCVRNPFDVVATMHRRSGLSLRDRLGWYTMHCEAMQMILDRDEFPVLLVRHEDLVADSRAVCRRMFGWLGHVTTDEHLTRIQKRLFLQPHVTRASVDWPADIVAEVADLTSRFSYLSGYRLESGLRRREQIPKRRSAGITRSSRAR